MVKKFIMMNKLLNFIYKHTHRIAKKRVTTPNLDVGERWCPQWWFIWWHYYWREIGYQFMIPISYDTLEEAKFMTNKDISFEEKHAYWLRNVKEKMKLTDIEQDFK